MATGSNESRTATIFVALKFRQEALDLLRKHFAHVVHRRGLAQVGRLPFEARPQNLEYRVFGSDVLHATLVFIPYPRANEPVGIPPRRTGGSFVSTLINGRNKFRITH